MVAEYSLIFLCSIQGEKNKVLQKYKACPNSRPAVVMV